MSTLPVITNGDTKGSRAGTISIRGHATPVMVLVDGRMFRPVVGHEWPDVIYRPTDATLPPQGLKSYVDADGIIAQQLATVDAVKAADAGAPLSTPAAAAPAPAQQVARKGSGKRTRKAARVNALLDTGLVSAKQARKIVEREVRAVPKAEQIARSPHGHKKPVRGLGEKP